ncbi:MAG: asparagine synthase (glutamine-hydrolyzing) [Steroidobacteraceae bacterium]
MCGVAGFAGTGLVGEAALVRLREMCDAILHRGPDSDGYFVDGPVALGMRRLSIIDVSGGDQPICNEDGTVTVVFNGEIYNHHELRAQLLAAGHRFRTRCDTEVLVHLYEEYGLDMASRLHGMFAFSIWDSRNQRLYIARDRTGMKPLSYAVRGGGIVFCSELRSLYAFDRSSLRIAPGAVMEYLAYGYVPHPSSIFEGAKKLPPAHYLIWSPGKEIKVRRYWKQPTPDESMADEEELVEEIRRRLDRAVHSHLESEVPLGAFLSGGLDSSTVVALMTRHAAGRVKTFSIGFAEKAYDESAIARKVAAHFGTDHVELIVRPNVEAIFEDVAAMFDEPFADSSAIATYLVARLAREFVTVALSGDGGDELFGGYTRYRETLRRVGGRRHAAVPLLSAAGLMLPHAFPGRNRIVDMGRSALGRYATTLLLPVRADEGGIASEAHPWGGLRIEEHLKRHFPSELRDDFAAAMMHVDIETYLPGDILTKVDRTSMAVSLEARVPLLDCELVDFALQIPGERRVTAAESKRLFRRAINGIVPDFVLSRPKRGFQVPLADWFRGPLRGRIEALRSPSQAIAPYVNRGALERLVNEHSVGRRNHSAILWRLIVLDHWLASYSDGRLGRPPQFKPGDTIWSAEQPIARSGVLPNHPLPVSDPFLRSEAPQPALRIGVLVDQGNIPGYARRIIQDIQAANYCELAAVIVSQPTIDGHSLDRTNGIALKAYEIFVEPLRRVQPDPLTPVDCDDLLVEVPKIAVAANDSDAGRSFASEDLEKFRSLELDVLVDFGRVAPRGASLPQAKQGVWRYHFGDRRQYPRGSGFLRELIDGAPLSGIELIRLGATVDADVTVSRALFSTSHFLSNRENRFGPIWGARHFVIQGLWHVHRRQPLADSVDLESSHLLPAIGRLPSNTQVVRWIAGQALRRSYPFRERVNGPVNWQIAVRKSQVPLYVDASRAALSAFQWLAVEPKHQWADPVVFAANGQMWLFFEEVVGPSKFGRISCGRLTPDGALVEVRPVLQKPNHLSFPQIVESDGEIFMIPEAAQSGGLDLYRARRFPDEWSYETRLLSFRCVDSSIFHAQASWWMVTSPQLVPGHAPITWLLRSDRITGPWTFCPGGTVANDASVARGGGRIIVDGARLIRPSQDCSSAYGRALLFNEILSLGEPYQELTICRIDAKRIPSLAAVHSYSRSGEWEAIDGGFRT